MRVTLLSTDIHENAEINEKDEKGIKAMRRCISKCLETGKCEGPSTRELNISRSFLSFGQSTLQRFSKNFLVDFTQMVANISNVTLGKGINQDIDKRGAGNKDIDKTDGKIQYA